MFVRIICHRDSFSQTADRFSQAIGAADDQPSWTGALLLEEMAAHGQRLSNTAWPASPAIALPVRRPRHSGDDLSSG